MADGKNRLGQHIDDFLRSIDADQANDILRRVQRADPDNYGHDNAVEEALVVGLTLRFWGQPIDATSMQIWQFLADAGTESDDSQVAISTVQDFAHDFVHRRKRR